MTAAGHIPSWIGAAVCDRHGTPVGTVHDLLYDERTRQPAWLLVEARGSFTFVPAAGAHSRTTRVCVPFDAEAIAASPVTLAAPAPLPAERQIRLCRHFGLPSSQGMWAGGVAPAHPERCLDAAPAAAPLPVPVAS